MLTRLLLLLTPSIAAAGASSPFANLFFEPNLGQAAPEAQFLARTPGARLFFERDGVRIVSQTGAVRLRFADARRDARYEPLDATADRSAWFVGGDPSRWRRDVPHYARLAWRGVYPGIDAIFYGTGGKIEYDLVVAPGVDPGRIRMRFDGAAVSISDSGDLDVDAGPLQLTMLRPRIYQRTSAGQEQAVESRYRKTGSEVAFSVERYDGARELVVDPVLQIANYVGAERDDSVVAVTTQGDVVGVTSSPGMGDGKPRSGKDVFVLLAAQNASTGTLL